MCGFKTGSGVNPNVGIEIHFWVQDETPRFRQESIRAMESKWASLVTKWTTVPSPNVLFEWNHF